MRRSTPARRALRTEYSIRGYDSAGARGTRELEIARSSIAFGQTYRWNAVAIILRANKDHPSCGGHIASFNRLRRFTTSASAISGARRPRSMAAT